MLWLAPSGASADTSYGYENQDGWVWGAATLELATGASILLELAVLPETDDNGPRLTAMGIGSLVLSGVIGYLGWANEWPHPIPLAVHGAIWSGLTMLFLGSVLPFAVGMSGAEGFEFGTVAWTLAGLGIVEGALAGALIVDGGSETSVWMTAPGAGLMGGLLLTGLIAVIFGMGWDADEVGQAIGWTMFLSLGATMAGVHIYAALDDAAPPSRVSSAP